MEQISRRGFLAASAGLGAATVLPRPAGARSPSLAAPPRPTTPWALRRYDRFERTLTGLPAVANPFDAHALDVWAYFRDPSGRTSRVPAFWFQDYTRTQAKNGKEQLTASGAPEWRVRFTPTRAGHWHWHWRAVDAKGRLYRGPTGNFVVTERHAPGFVRRSTRDARYLVHDDGSPYFPIGENVAWYDNKQTFDYDRWFGQLHEQGANYARLWMPYWAFALEAPGSPLGDYTDRLAQAWELDYVFDLARDSGIALMLSLQNHGPFSLVFNSEWDVNPYNAANGGPLGEPQDFFTNPIARLLFRRRMRYCVARWGYAPHLAAWELWNEVDLTGGYEVAAVAAWHRAMAAHLRDLDTNRHLVTTSLSLYPSILQQPSDGALWDTTNLDFTQVHRYTTLDAGIPVGDQDVSRDLPNLAGEMLDRHHRPTLVAEYGVDAGSATATLDPDGIALHDSLWSSALSGALGSAMTWWWDTYVDADPDRLYPMFGALVRFLSHVAWDREHFGATTASVLAPGRNVVVHGLDGAGLRLVWIKNDDHQWNHPDPTPVTGATCDLGVAPGIWIGEWWDTTVGALTHRFVVFGRRGHHTHVALPTFTGDVALRIRRFGAR